MLLRWHCSAIRLIALAPHEPACGELHIFTVGLLIDQNLLLVFVPANVTNRTSPRVSPPSAALATWCTTSGPKSNPTRTSPAQGRVDSRCAARILQASRLTPQAGGLSQHFLVYCLGLALAIPTHLTKGQLESLT